MHSISSSVSFKHSLRLSLLCLLATYALLHSLPARVHSSSQTQTTQSLAPDFNTGALSSPREGHTATLSQNGKVLVAGGRNGGTVFNTAEVYDPLTGAWTAAGSMVIPRYGHSAVLLRSGQVLAIGGQNSSGFLNTVEIYDPIANAWRGAASMTAARFHSTATLLNNGQVLVAGGQNATGSLRSAELYDPGRNTWTRLDQPNNPAGNLTEARAEHTATLLGDGRVLVAGGVNGANILRSAEVYEPNLNRWRRVGALSVPRRLHTATLLPDRSVLVVGGANGLNSAETYNVMTGAWTSVGALANGRSSHTATLLPNGRVLVVGGKNAAGNPLNSAEVYNYVAKTWSNAPLPPPFPSTQPFTLNEARSDHTATMLPNGQVLIAGGLGNDNAVLNSAELYEYAAGSWSLTKNASTGATTQMIAARAGHTATLLTDGKVLVVGGVRANSPLIATNTVELYDPATGTWSTTSPLNNPRFNHTATLLPNGKVLVVGGLTEQGATSAELYDPATGNWTNTPAPGVARYYHTATLLPNRSVLVVGGVGFGGVRTNSVQLYDPNGGVNGSWSTAPTLPAPRSNHSATLLPNGTVFIFGGLASNTTAYNNGAIFTPSGASGSWTPLNFTDTGSAAAPAFRHSHLATLLPTNKVLISGGLGGTLANNVGTVIGTGEIFNIGSSTFDRNRATIASRFDHTATVLPNGKVLLFGGQTISQSGSGCGNPSAIPPAQIFDPFVPVGSAVTQVTNPLQARNAHTTTLLLTGQVLIAGGQAAQVPPDCANPLLNTAELFDSGLGFQESWRPVISFLRTATVINGNNENLRPEQTILTTVNGTQFQGISETSGHGAQSSATNYPIAQLRSLGNEQFVFLPVNSDSGWTNNTFNYNSLASFAPGPALLTIFANGVPSVAHVVNSNGSDFVLANAPRRGSISGRVILHNGTGLAANVRLEPAEGSPAGCTATRTITTTPSGEFVFRDLTIRPVPPTITCGPNLFFECTSPNGCVVQYQAPVATPAGTAVTCTPPSGAVFPLGTTAVNCRATNAAGSATCSFNVTLSRPTTLTLTCPPDPAPVRAARGSQTAQVFFSAPVANPSQGTTITCTHTSGQQFPIGTTSVTCTATNASLNQQASCSFNVTVLPPIVGLAGSLRSAPPISPPNSVVRVSASPEQQPACRYRVTPTATIGNQTLSFFPAAAIFNLIDESGGLSFNLSDQLAPKLSAPEQTVGQTTCQNCSGFIFVTQPPPAFNIAGRVLTPDESGVGVPQINLEFAVPYEIFDDQLTCEITAANPTGSCKVAGAKTINGDACVKASSNLLDPAKDFHCACTSLRSDGTCEKTVLARYQSASDGSFQITRIPPGANAIVTPSNRPSGPQYTFAYQPLSPPGLLPQDFIQIDNVLATYDSQNIIAQAGNCPAVTGLNPASGFAGNTVTLTGTGFTGVTGVRFTNNVAATFTVNSDMQITATVPNGAVTGVITLSRTGCPDAQSASFTILTCPTINIAPASLPVGTVGVAYSANLTQTGAIGAVNWSISAGALPAGLSLNATSGVISGAPTASGTSNFTVRVSDANNCSGTRSYSLTINACSYAINPASQSFPASGGSGTVNVTAATGCAWTAGSNATWLTVTSGSSGNGNGAVGFSVAANTGVARSSTLTIAGQTFTVTQLEAAPAFVTVSAASFRANAPLAAASIASGFGVNLATATAAATTIPLPTTLAGTTVRVRDSAGMERLAPLFFVSAAQINYLIPTGTANGAAQVIVTAGDGKTATGSLQIATVAPGLFTANATGQGVVAGLALRVAANGAQTLEPLARYDEGLGRFVAVPVDLGPATEQVFLVVFGTGFRAANSLNNVSVMLGGTGVPVLFAGAQGDLVGLDQINLGPLPRTLIGRGNVELALTVEGQAANTVQVNIK
jgi:uncharacterized protein (TIGR03437 family)